MSPHPFAQRCRFSSSQLHPAPPQDLVQALSDAKGRFVSGGAKSYFEPSFFEVISLFFSVSNAPTRPHSVCIVCRQFAWQREAQCARASLQIRPSPRWSRQRVSQDLLWFSKSFPVILEPLLLCIQILLQAPAAPETFMRHYVINSILRQGFYFFEFTKFILFLISESREDIGRRVHQRTQVETAARTIAPKCNRRAKYH
jgi:hypothetical protein